MATSNSGKKKGPLDVVVVYAFDSTTSTPDYNKVNEIFWLVQKRLANFQDSCLSYIYVELKFNRYTSGKKLVGINKYIVTESTTGCTKNMASGLPEAHRLISLLTENPSGVILLFSDGSPNNKGDFFDKAEEYVSTVPVHTFTLGSAAYNQGLSTIAANSPGGSFNSMPIPDKPDESSPLSQRLDAILQNSTTSDDENPPKLQVTPATAFGEYKEINFQGLYLYHTYSGPKANQAGILDNRAPIGIGQTTVNNWEVYDGAGANAKLVARAQGLHTYAGKWHNSFSLVFVDERFSGSTLEVMGIVVETGEWAVVGGTGQFAMANGVIYKRTHKSTSDGNIIELTICAFCPQLKGTRYPITKIGPWGGSEGSAMDITEAPPKRLESITINTGWVVDSIAFSYVDYTGQKRSASRWGGSGGQPHTIQLGESEFVTEVSGTVGKHEGQTVISSIKFVTNLNKTYGPWGEARDNPSPFNIPVQPGSAIVGFFARAGKFINAIGFHVRPL